MLLGAAGAIIPYFFLHWGENVTGFAAFGLAAGGLVIGSLLGRARAIESPQSLAPKDALLFALAETYEKAGSSTDARATYQRLVNDYPNSPYRNDAREKVGS